MVFDLRLPHTEGSHVPGINGGSTFRKQITILSLAAAHLPFEAVTAKVEQAANRTQLHHWQIVFNALVDPPPGASMQAVTEALIVGLNELRADPERVGPVTYFPHFQSLA
ncbi:MAG: hypothetical protein NVSMB42_05050 [Herpetosiphon sp.]